VRRAQSGDTQAFEELVGPHGDTLTREAERCLDSQLRELVAADDVVQEVHIRAFRGLPAARFDRPAGLRAWLLKILRRVCQDLARRHRPELRPTSLDGNTARTASGTLAKLVDLIPGRERSPSSEAANEEHVLQLDDLLRNLSADQRAVLRMTLFEHLDSRAVAERTGKSQDTVRKTLQRALESCRETARRRGWDLQ
jgi:RNA polymerase sigma-70 factor (ECF subfamily)